MPASMPVDPANPFAGLSTLAFGVPDFANVRTEHYQPAIEAGMADQLAELAEVASNAEPPTVANVIEVWEASGQLLVRALKAFQATHFAEADDALDAVDAAIGPLLAAHEDAIRLDRALYDRVRALAARRDAGQIDLDPQSAYWLQRTLLAFERAGVGLEEADQVTLRSLNSRIADLHSAYRRQEQAGRTASAVLVTDARQLAGLSDAEVEGARELAAERGHETGWLIELDYPTGQRVLGVLHDRGLRERIHRASTGRGLGGEHDTRAIIVELARCRAERAVLLGFANHADYVAADGCAGTSGAVGALLTGLAPSAVANARAEAVEMEPIWRQVEPEAPMAPWDWPYVSELLRTQRYALDLALLRPHLELERVLHAGVFEAATALYGITFRERSDVVGYNPDVRVFEVAESDGTPIGLFLADLHTRRGKTGGAWCDTLVDQNHLLAQGAVVGINLNLVKPPTGQPTLMRWDDVIGLFHEFGHALHCLLSQTRYRSRSGTETPRDFVEYPSQVNEMWALDADLLQRYALHHETGEPMPSHWGDTLRASTRFQQGSRTTAQVAAALLDQVWHTTPVDELPTKPDEVEEFEARALAGVGLDYELVPPWYRSTYFGHVFGGWGYDAGFYSYLWSEVLAADTATFIAGTGGLTRDNGERFRRGVLAHGGSIDVMDAYRDYRGQDPDLTHLLRRRGLNPG